MIEARRKEGIDLVNKSECGWSEIREVGWKREKNEEMEGGGLKWERLAAEARVIH